MARAPHSTSDAPPAFAGAPHTIPDVPRPVAGFQRSRLLQSALAASTLLLGLASRRPGWHLPPWVGAYAGDALWALLVFWLTGLLRPKWSSATVAVGAGSFALSIELSQLCQWPWLVALRHTVLGGLVLGWVFQWRDLACYTVGVAIGYGLETCWLRRPGK